MGCVSAKPHQLPNSNPSSQADRLTFDPPANILSTIGETGITTEDLNHTGELYGHSTSKRHANDVVSDLPTSPKRHFGDETYVHNSVRQQKPLEETGKRTNGDSERTGLFGHIFSGNDKKQRKTGIQPFHESSEKTNHVDIKLTTTREESGPSGAATTSHSVEEGSQKKAAAGLSHFFHFGQHNGSVVTSTNNGDSRDRRKENCQTDDNRRPHGAPLTDQLHKNFQERLVTAQLSKASLAGGKCLTESQRDFFRMLDDKIAQGNPEEIRDC